MDPSPESVLVGTSLEDPSEQDTAVRLRCWGTRGSIPSPGPATAGYGGNTPCIEIRARGRRLIFDAGSGIRLLGLELMEEGGPFEATIFLSHFHWDHIQGFPFFAPLYHPATNLRIIGPMQRNIDIKSLFAGQMGPIYFPVPFSALAATTVFDHLNEGSWEEDGVVVSAMRVRHPSFTVGYRVDAGGRRVCIIPDNELVGGDHEVTEGWRERLRTFVADADLLIHDSMYTEAEYPAKIGWGHSTFSQSVALAAEAGVKKLLFFHHAPERSDGELDRLVEQAREEAASTAPGLDLAAAREGSDLEF